MPFHFTRFGFDVLLVCWFWDLFSLATLNQILCPLDSDALPKHAVCCVGLTQTRYRNMLYAVGHCLYERWLAKSNVRWIDGDRLLGRDVAHHVLRLRLQLAGFCFNLEIAAVMSAFILFRMLSNSATFSPISSSSSFSCNFRCLLTMLVCRMSGWIRGRDQRLAWALGGTALFFLLRIFGLLPVSLAGVPVAGAIQFVKYCFPLYLALVLLAARGVTGAGRGAVGLALVCLSLEMLFLLPRAWPERVDAWRPAAWVEALREGTRVLAGFLARYRG